MACFNAYHNSLGACFTIASLIRFQTMSVLIELLFVRQVFKGDFFAVHSDSVYLGHGSSFMFNVVLRGFL
jgi:hypothetical protein